jgi:CheY-like chemotaxis protein
MSDVSPKILIVDDNEATRDSFCIFFRDCGWIASEAEDGEAALDLLRSSNWSYNCIILDKKMPNMDGPTFLRTLREQERRDLPIPVIVLSGYIDDDAEKKTFEESGAVRVFSKPQTWDLLEAVARAIATAQDPSRHKSEAEQTVTAHGIDQRVRQHENLLKENFEAKTTEYDESFHKVREPILVVARRWNSWYPSFFDVAGGAYAIAFPKCDGKHRDRRNRVLVVDPGFRFLQILGEMGLSVRDMDACVVTHNHPDHLGGVFEYIACRNQTGRPVRFFCNPSTRRILSEFANTSVTVEELPDQGRGAVIFDYRDSTGTRRSLEIGSFSTDHKEIGWDNDARGLVLTANSGEGDHDSGWTTSSHSVILGDTAFMPVSQAMDLPALLAGDENTRIVVLHIGSAQLRRRVGGHLYLTGLPRLLNLLAEELEKRRRDRTKKMVVLISEWGLEHATAQQMTTVCPEVNGFEETSIIVETIAMLRNRLDELGLDRLVVLPADIGLMVGMESGNVFLKQQHRNQLDMIPAENVRFLAGTDGIRFCR